MANARRPGNMRAVPAKTARRSPSLTAAADGGDERELLVALQARLAEAIADPACPPRDMAPLSRRLLEVAEQLRELNAAAAPVGRRLQRKGDVAWRPGS
jgi:hypothetical protein